MHARLPVTGIFKRAMRSCTFGYPMRPFGRAISEGSPRIARMSHTLHCKKRATWRFPAKKPAERLSSHSGLDCEYGTSLMTCWQGGGGGPLYVCEDHAKALSSKEIRTSRSTIIDK
jgi:hypothetical protein